MATLPPPASLTQRDVRLPQIPGKPLAIIGVRRDGKTSFLHQQRARRMAEGRPAESQLLIGLEDERLVGMKATDLGWMIAEHERQFPALGEGRELSVYLDEVQLVPGWESLVHREAASPSRSSTTPFVPRGYGLGRTRCLPTSITFRTRF